MTELWEQLLDRQALTALAAIAVIVALVASTWILKRPFSNKFDWVAELEESKKQRQRERETSPALASSAPIQDVWAERQAKGVAPASLNHRIGDQDKPIASSYYYAHNSHSKTGGYKDGLRMEDYTMNGPRLLSRGGSRVESETASETATPPSWAAPEAAPVPKAVTAGKRVLPINKYLFDDPGDSKCIATIRIDQLPGKISGESIAWKDANVTDIKASKVGDGVLVEVQTPEIDYRLAIAVLYGEISEVKAVVAKANKRLLVRLHKKTSLLDKSNAKAWPHPHKKAT